MFHWRAVLFHNPLNVKDVYVYSLEERIWSIDISFHKHSNIFWYAFDWEQRNMR